LFVFPSLAEGYGMPLIEADAFGAPSIASDIPPFREIGLSSGYFDPHSITAIAAAIDHAPARDPESVPREDRAWAMMVEQLRGFIEEGRRDRG
jgi:alpha-1,2-rhamnosyltransferase